MGLSQSRLPLCHHGGKVFLTIVSEGRLAEVKEALEDEPSLAAYVKPLVGTSPLHVAAAAGREDLLRVLLAAVEASLEGKSSKAAARLRHKVLNQCNQHGQTALMLACKRGSPRCVRQLLAAGADPCIFDRLSHSTCLHYAARYGWPEVIDVLLGNESWVTTAVGGTGGGRRVLLRDAVVVDTQGHHKFADGRANLGLAPLHWAASHGHLAAAQALIGWGACITARCNLFLEERGQGPWVPFSTPLHLAAAKGNQHMVLLLLKAWAERGRAAGPDPRTMRDFWDRRPVEVALSAGHRAVVPLLNPATPLSHVVWPAAPAVPRLATLAAAALRLHLAAQLDAMSAQQAQQGAGSQDHAVLEGEGPAQTVQQAQQAVHQESELPLQQRSQPEAAGPRSGQPASSSCPICLEEATTAAAPPTAGSELAPAGRQQQQSPCRQLVAAVGCGHALCLGCARELCSGAGTGSAPVACPLCRAVVGAWVPACAAS